MTNNQINPSTESNKASLYADIKSKIIGQIKKEVDTVQHAMPGHTKSTSVYTKTR